MPVITQSLIDGLVRAAGADRKNREVVDSKADGLRLRVGPRGGAWRWKVKANGRAYSLSLGPTTEWSIAEARLLAHEATQLVRTKTSVPDDRWLFTQRRRFGKIHPVLTPKPTTRTEFGQWNFKQAREKYLDEVARTLSPSTHDDYRRMLHAADLEVLEDEKVARITRQRLAEIVAAVHSRGTERHAEHLAAVLRPMWTWLSADAQVAKSGVQPEVMDRLRAPARSRRAKAAPVADAKPSHYVPSLLEVGRILAIARSGALDENIGSAVELLVMTVQRRRPIGSARVEQFIAIEGKGGAWSMPPSHRKTAERRGDEGHHVVPLPPSVWLSVQQQIERANEWLFPQFRPRRAGDPLEHMDAAVLTRALLLMPGVTASPHDLRRAFATHGEEELGFTRAETKLILDHNEGTPTNDVTRSSYALGAGLAGKWPVMERWVDAVEKAARDAIAADLKLNDVDWLNRQIADARYGR